ncbi:hypothetical protein BURPSS13_C0100 [Burkholderia pseudomallei S13]|nr:hypothetical protein BURPSS13_C0100 [Burkholderia pseudomallei S13]
MPLVNTTGISAASLPRRRASSRITSTPVNARWSRSSNICAPIARARSAKSRPCATSTASRLKAVKSPSTASICGCTGGRFSTVRFRQNAGDWLQRPTTSANAASATPAGLSPKRLANATSASQRARSSRAWRCVKRGRASARPSGGRGNTGRSGRPGKPSMRASHQAASRACCARRPARASLTT